MPQWSLMNLKILLPFRIFAEQTRVMRIVAETRSGSFGILPHRRDFVAALTPGILLYECESEGETFVAVDQGILIKAGAAVLVSVRDAIGGANLRELRDAVESEFVELNESEQQLHTVMKKMESGFIGRLARYHHE